MQRSGRSPPARDWVSLVPMASHPLKEPAKRAYREFLLQVPTATRVKEAVYAVGGGKVRVKLAKTTANQVQVWRGEPVVVFVPDGAGGTWHVLTVRWQLRYAKAHPDRAQHASHSFDCMSVPLRDLPAATPPTDLKSVCESAASAAHSPLNQAVVSAIDRTRGAVADVLIDALEPVVDAATGKKDP